MRLASKNKPPLAGVSASGVEEAPPPGLVSEVDFPTELENSPGVGGNELAETAIILAGINVLELCMVPSVEGLQAKLEAAATGFTEREGLEEDRKSTRLNSSHSQISYAVFCLKKKIKRRFYFTGATSAGPAAPRQKPRRRRRRAPGADRRLRNSRTRPPPWPLRPAGSPDAPSAGTAPPSPPRRRRAPRPTTGRARPGAGRPFPPASRFRAGAARTRPIRRHPPRPSAPPRRAWDRDARRPEATSRTKRRARR